MQTTPATPMITATPFSASWVQIVAILRYLLDAVKSCQCIANSLPRPTKDAIARYINAFTFIHHFAGNKERAKIPASGQSSNFTSGRQALTCHGKYPRTGNQQRYAAIMAEYDSTRLSWWR